ncbi:MAG: hypothetical protein HY077_01475 [Elusimicrobia bacterium]|nr:hypothetical protein [Elusimicrobiota bacterium]
MAAKPEVVAYLLENLKKFSANQLREQLAQEGISQKEFDEAFSAAQQAALAAPARKPSPAGKIFLAGAGAAVIIAALVSLSHKPAEEPPPPPPATSAESAYVGHYDYVVRLPKDYVAVQKFKDDRKTIEQVYFCKAGTDPTQFLNEGLYGQLGIVRLQAEPSEFANDLNGLAALTRAASSRAASRGEKFSVKNIQISSLRGIQVNYEMPNARVECFILGDKVLYSFLAGEDDDTFRDILNSLRDANSES